MSKNSLSKNKKLKIAFYAATDETMLCATLSLLMSVNDLYSKEEFDFYLATNNFKAATEKFKNYENVHIIDFSNRFNGKLSFITDVVLFNRITYPSFFRLFIGEKIDDSYKSIIYLDVDGILLKRIPQEYIDYDKNISFYPRNTIESMNNTLRWIKGALKNERIKDNLVMKLNQKQYFQSGLIIINSLSEYNVLGLKILRYLKKNRKKEIVDDQNLLNYFNKNHIEILDNSSINYRPLFSEFVNVDDIVFLHFAGNQKPWSDNFDFESHRGFTKYIEKYYDKKIQ